MRKWCLRGILWNFGSRGRHTIQAWSQIGSCTVACKKIWLENFLLRIEGTEDLITRHCFALRFLPSKKISQHEQRQVPLEELTDKIDENEIIKLKFSPSRGFQVKLELNLWISIKTLFSCRKAGKSILWNRKKRAGKRAANEEFPSKVLFLISTWGQTENSSWETRLGLNNRIIFSFTTFPSYFAAMFRGLKVKLRRT